MNYPKSIAVRSHSPRQFISICMRGVAICGLLLASSLSASLYAQQTDELPAAISPHTELADNSSPAAGTSRKSDDTSTTQPLLPETLTFRDRLRLYEHSFISPQSLVGPLWGAGISQAEGTPHEWGGGMEGFGLRFGSAYGRSVIGRTIGFGVASVDGEDTRYRRSTESGVWRRTRHAVLSTFIATNSNGDSMPAYSRFAGSYGAGFIANAWEPPSQDSTSHALIRGSTSLLSSVGFHVIQEFWPDIRGVVHHHSD
jgi:hypothetical protein